MVLVYDGYADWRSNAIQWKDIDFETGVLSITKTLYYKNQSEYHFTEPKTQASVRQIVLDKTTLVLLKAWKNVQRKVVKTGYVMSYNGIPTQKHTIAHAIDRYSKQASYPNTRLTHSHASLLIQMGENPLIIKERGYRDDTRNLWTFIS